MARETFLQGQRRKLAEQRSNRITPILDDLIGLEDVDDLMMQITDALTSEDARSVQSGKYYTFLYLAKTPNIRYDQHPLVAVLDVVPDWGFRGLNYHWGKMRNYTFDEVMSGIYNVTEMEFRSLRSIPFGRFRLNT